MNVMTAREIQEFLDIHFGGILSAGTHAQGSGEACALEAFSAMRGLRWTDNPRALGMLDLRPLNDSLVWASNLARTQALVPIIGAYWDWVTWPLNRQIRVEAKFRVAVRLSQSGARLDLYSSFPAMSAVSHAQSNEEMQEVCKEWVKIAHESMVG